MDPWQPIGSPYKKYESHVAGPIRAIGTENNLPVHLSRDGYPCVSFRDGARVVTIRVHRLNATAHKGHLKAGDQTEIDHKNRVKTDNHARNLRWSTVRENCDNRGKPMPKVRHAQVAAWARSEHSGAPWT